jgi:hypothetical protein
MTRWDGPPPQVVRVDLQTVELKGRYVHGRVKRCASSPARFSTRVYEGASLGPSPLTGVQTVSVLQDRAGGTLHVGRSRAIEDREGSCRLCDRGGPQ